jgi:hypothetical protein
MLERLEMRDVGPSSSMRLDLAPRLNVLTGDNGLGKTHALDAACSALTEDPAARGREVLPVFYVRVNGSFFTYEPARGTARSWSSKEVWDALVFNWVTWQRQRDPAFEILTRVLEILSPHPGEAIRPGAATHDVRDVPTIDLPYGTIPVVHASAGMKRILALAYLLVWMWREHVGAAKLRNTVPSKSLVMLFDEVEAHLHPQWQRVLLPALFLVVRELSPEIEVQILATTHAPLVLASLEPHFDEAKDALFHFEVKEKQVQVSKVPWRARGDASAWLTSEVFELGEARSLEAERAIVAAKEAMRQPDLPIEEARRIHHELHAVLKDTDPFWPRWLVRAKQAGVAP